MIGIFGLESLALTISIVSVAASLLIPIGRAILSRSRGNFEMTLKIGDQQFRFHDFQTMSESDTKEIISALKQNKAPM